MKVLLLHMSTAAADGTLNPEGTTAGVDGGGGFGSAAHSKAWRQACCFAADGKIRGTYASRRCASAAAIGWSGGRAVEGRDVWIPIRRPHAPSGGLGSERASDASRVSTA